LAQLKKCSQEGFYKNIAIKTEKFTAGINLFCSENNYPLELVSIGSIFWFSFNGKKRIVKSSQIDPDMSYFNKLHNFLLNNGVYIGPSGYEVGFVSDKHSHHILDEASLKIIEGIKELFG
jgi:glutamate-1-semialdehyde 2,1-aminomutase